MTATATEPAAPQSPEMTTPDLSRRLCYILASAAERLGVPHDENADFEDLARAIIITAQVDRTRLPPHEYRWIWGIWQIFRKHRLGGDGSPTPFPPPAA
jgi:hypothetical protein